MRIVRRALQAVAVLGTLVVGLVALALIVSQTPWFRDWLRQYLVRESRQYLNGELSIGGIGGNLLFGVQVNDIAIDLSGERVLAVRTLEVDYSVLTIISEGIVLDRIVLVEPAVRLVRDAAGWNLGRLVTAQEREADREGPGRAITLQAFEVAGGQVEIVDRVGAGAYRLPERVEGLDIRGSFEYEPVRYSLALDHVSLRASSPDLTLHELSTKVATRDDTLFIDSLVLRTGESAVSVDGSVENYLETPIVRLTSTGHVSLPEIGRIVPAAGEYALTPRFTVKASGPIEQLALDLDVQTEAGTVQGQVTADVQAPGYALDGTVDLARLDLAPLLRDPAHRSDITGRADVHLRVADGPETVPLLDRTAGTFQFTGPTVVAAGYRATDVRASGTLESGRLTLDGRAAAYGGTATARGFLVLPSGGRALAFDLRGAAGGIDLRRLPRQTGAPALATDLSVSEYHVTGQGQVISGSAVLDESTVEGATLGAGTVANFQTAPDGITFAAKGSIADLNLPRLGRALEIPALQEAAYDGRINGDFSVAGGLPPAARRDRNETALSVLTLEASGTLRDSSIMGGQLPEMAFETHLNEGALDVRADGRFAGFNPATLANRQEVDGTVSGTVNLALRIADLGEPITPAAMTASGQVVLEASEVGGLRIDAARVEGTYASEVADLTALQVKSPDVVVDASGRLALDRTSTSDLRYTIEAINLEALAGLAGQEGVTGSARLEGTVTGNAVALETRGTLDGSNLGYGENRALDLESTYAVAIPDLDASAARVEADTTATFVKAGGLDINALTAKTTYAAQRLDFATHVQEGTRELDASGTLILHPDHQEIHLPQLAVRTQGVEWRMAPGLDPKVNYGGGRLAIANVHLVSGDQSLEVSGEVALKGDEPVGELAVRAQNVDLQQLETLLLLDRGLGGRLAADATISGSLEAPAVDGTVTITGGSFESYTYDSLTANVQYGGTRIGLDATLQQSPTEAITATGTVPMSLFQPSPGGHVDATDDDRVDLHIRSTALSLGVVQGFTTQVTDVTGTLQADVRVTGSGQDPHVEGFVDIKGGSFAVPLGGVSYSGLDTRIELAEDRVRLQQFSILDEHGQPLSVSGELAVHSRQVGQVNISIESNNFEVIDNELGDVGLDTRITITGELRRPIVRGTIRLEAARLEVDRILQLFYDPYSIEELPPVVSAERVAGGGGSADEETRAALRRAGGGAAPVPDAAPPAEEQQAEVAPQPSVFDALELDLKLIVPDNLVLRGRRLRPGGPTGASLGDLNITVGGDIQLVKPADGEMTLLGQVQTVRGTYDFQGRRFTLARGGTIRFMGEPMPNPLLDITATRVIPNTGVEAQVRIQGTVRVPELTLSSTPPLDESDILALIVFNRPVNELGTGERASLAATAGGIATGFIAAPLGESIGRALDLDIFEITTTTDDGEFGAGVTVGQQIGDRAFVRMRQQFGERTSTEFLLEYQLADFLRLRTTAAPETTGSANRLGQRRIERGGIDLIFFFSY